MVVKSVKKKTSRSRKTKKPLKVSLVDYEVDMPASPNLGKNVSCFKWSIKDKFIEMKIKESVDMDAFTWISGIDDRYDKAKLHTHLANQDMINLTLFNNNKEKIATYRFAKLLLNDHSTYVSNELSCGELVHLVKLSFERTERDQD